ncbi:hypothetical protein [Nitrincola sp.]|uniref:hypothetical protein n=1 Tax=Nitrincola sp. TaxID=1926584 RepID=UPI003A94550A
MQQLSWSSPALVAPDRLWLARQGKNREVLMTKDIRIFFVGDSFVNGTGMKKRLDWLDDCYRLNPLKSSPENRPRLRNWKKSLPR